MVSFLIQAMMANIGTYKTSSDGSDGFASRRLHPRRTSDQCVGSINGKTHPVLDWSPGGMRVFADARPIAVGEDMDIEMKFHLRDQLVAIKHRGTVIRKSNDSVSFKFKPLTADIRRVFQNVIDDFNAREFAGSQV